jgi:hypothetical protein
MRFIDALSEQVPDFPLEQLEQAFAESVRRELPFKAAYPAFVGPMPRKSGRWPARLCELIQERAPL